MESSIVIKGMDVQPLQGLGLKQNLSRVILWLAWGKITKGGTLVFDASPNSVQSSIQSGTQMSQGPFRFLGVIPRHHACPFHVPSLTLCHQEKFLLLAISSLLFDLVFSLFPLLLLPDAISLKR